MQDRFKFRAWNKLSNEMKDVISLNINHSFPDCSNVILETNTFDNIKTHNNPITCANGLKNVVLMQCTGLKDKNGKLIYEGDIIQFYIDDDNPYARSFVTMKIVWEDYELDFKAIGLNKNVECYKDDFQYLSCINIQQDELEIIGNIYENPELLEDKR